jgi:hypothetical protein
MWIETCGGTASGPFCRSWTPSIGSGRAESLGFIEVERAVRYRKDGDDAVRGGRRAGSQRRTSPRSPSRSGRRSSLLERLNQFHVGLFERAQGHFPSKGPVPGKLREVGAQPIVLEIPASAGENLVANNGELIGGKALQLFGCQIPATGVRKGVANLRFRLGWQRTGDTAGRGHKGLARRSGVEVGFFDRLNGGDVGLFDRAERDLPGMRPVPGKLQEIGAKCVILEEPASAGENFVASDVKLIGGQGLQFGGAQVSHAGVLELNGRLSEVRASLIDAR